MCNLRYEQSNNHIQLYHALKINHEATDETEKATAANATSAYAIPAARNKVCVNTDSIQISQNEAYGVLESLSRSSNIVHEIQNSETDEDYAYVQLRARCQ